MEFEVIQGDIAQQSADAVVNAANTGMQMGSGVAGALREAGGEQLNDEAVGKGPVDLGGVIVTDAFELDADYVVHAAAMEPGGTATAESIRKAARNALEAADERGCESLVMPALGTGVAGFSTEEGARIVARVIADFEPDSLRDVRFVASGAHASETVRRVADEVLDG
jgi:O-acetyl-ADP-ribose deacetylase (regulator of RNase III)